MTLGAFEKMSVEGHRGILSYSENEVAVRMAHGNLLVTGDNLEITELNPDELVLHGRIDAIAREKCKKISTK